jgi:hypothetical protein
MSYYTTISGGELSMEVLVMFLNTPAYRYDPQLAQDLELLTGSKQIQAHHIHYRASWL